MRTLETLGSLHLKTIARQKRMTRIGTKREVVPETGNVIETEGGWEIHTETEIVTETEEDRGMYFLAVFCTSGLFSADCLCCR